MLADSIWTTIKKILPWTLIIMLISFGIAYITGGLISGTEGQVGDSYIYLRIINDNKFYEFDLVGYVNGLKFRNIFDSWEQWFKNMTDLLKFKFEADWTNKPWRSLANVIIGLINYMLQIINILVCLPTQLITQILTLVLRILGQQINQNSTFWLGKALYWFNNDFIIPLISYIPVN